MISDSRSTTGDRVVGPRLTDRRAALSGIIAPALFLLATASLMRLQYDFLDGLGDFAPSLAALGPHGWWQVANFILSGVLLTAFATGIHRGVARRRWSLLGPALMGLAGVGMVLLGFKTDPPGGRQSWHGLIHALAYFLFVGSLLLSYIFLWLRVRQDPRWRGYRRYCLLALLLLIPAPLLPGPVAANYVFFGILLLPLEALAIWFWTACREVI